MPNVTCIMPCIGRAQQTLTLIPRLISTAGYDGWDLWCMCDGDQALAQTLRDAYPKGHPRVHIGLFGTRRGYWRALQGATGQTAAPLLVNLASDLLPGHQWLRRALQAYLEMPRGGALVGFNDGLHEEGHSPHLLIGRDLLDSFGGWPVWYDHLYGDVELCERAQAAGRYRKLPWATLYHNHPYTGAAGDEVYALGSRQEGRDRALFEQRKAAGWPAVGAVQEVAA